MANLKKFQIDLDQHPEHYEAAVGDVIQCFINFPLTPGNMVDDIVVKVGGQSLAKIGVTITSDFGRPGAGQMSAFLFVYGDFTGNDEFITVELTPVIPDQIETSYEMTFKVPVIEP